MKAQKLADCLYHKISLKEASTPLTKSQIKELMRVELLKASEIVTTVLKRKLPPDLYDQIVRLGNPFNFRTTSWVHLTFHIPLLFFKRLLEKGALTEERFDRFVKPAFEEARKVLQYQKPKMKVDLELKWSMKKAVLNIKHPYPKEGVWI